MLRAGIVLQDNCCPEIEAMIALLGQAFDQGQGTIGFGKTLITLPPISRSWSNVCFITSTRSTD